MKEWEINPFVRWAGTVYNYERSYFCAAYDARILFVLQGDAEIEIKESESRGAQIIKYMLRERSLAYIPPGVSYRIRRPSEELRLAAINFDFAYDYSNQSKALKMKTEGQYNKKKAHTVEMVPLKIYQAPFVVRRAAGEASGVEEILEEFEQQYKYYREISSAALKKILFSLATMPKTDSKIEDTFLNFAKYVEKHYNEELSNSDIAKILCYHPNYLSRVIKKRTGKSMHKYIMEYRIMQAEKLLNSTDLAISDIAMRTGFKNSDHFSAYFKKITGINAREYSKINV